MNWAKLLLIAVALGLSGCMSYPPLTDDVEITRIVVEKGKRRMFLMSGDERVARFPIHLGFAPEGDKLHEGDGKTPEGDYLINRRNPQSAYHLSLGINYPLPDDVKEAAAEGRHPGGDIFIHGMPRGYSIVESDWTNGCIAVSNEHIETIYKVVPNGTPITILP